MDFSDIDAVLNSLNTSSVTFGQVVDMIINGGQNVNYKSITGKVFEAITGETGDIKELISKLLIIVIMSAVFVNISKTFSNRQVSETGFYITYIIMYMLLAVSFGSLYEMTKKVIGTLVVFMEALIPSFFMAVSYVAGSSGTIMFYQSALIVMALVEAVILKLILPLVNLYFVFAMVNPMLSEDYFSNMLILLKKLITWSIKSLLMLVSGAWLVESIILPAFMDVKSVLAKKLVSIPGAGSMLGTVFETVIGAGGIIKNAIGAAGLIAIFLICFIPVSKLCIYGIVYQGTAAIAQPVCGDKRLSDCVKAAAEAVRLLLMVSLISAVLFVITIAIVTLATGG